MGYYKNREGKEMVCKSRSYETLQEAIDSFDLKDFDTAESIYRHFHAFHFEYGQNELWEEISEVGWVYRRSNQSDRDKLAFAESVFRICLYWRFAFTNGWKQPESGFWL